jgi:polyhydroxyalkanoate synthase
MVFVQRNINLANFFSISVPSGSMTDQAPPAFPESKDDLQAQAKQIDDLYHAQLAKLALGLSPLALSLAFTDWALHFGHSPGKQMLLAKAMMDEWTSFPLTPDAAEEKDSRFTSVAWQSLPYGWLKTAYQAQERLIQKALSVDGVSHHHQQMLEIMSRQWIDALSPSNWPLTNPDFWSKTQESGGQNWIKGWHHFLEDMSETLNAHAGQHADQLKPLAFAVGQDVAITKGHILYRNDLIELIQYAPQTETVKAEPLLIVPSCIMKYYILDLSPENSFVRYLVSKGHTVFMVSWRNPDSADRALGFEDYIKSGVLDAMQAIKDKAGYDRVHTLGYCLGGTFLAIAAAAIGHHTGRENQTAHAAPSPSSYAYEKLPELASMTLLAAQVEFSEPGALGIFIDEDQLQTLRNEMQATGYLSGRQMAATFQFLNSRDLVWSRSTRRYLMGEDDVTLDMMSWNADVTRLPERMHSEYLNELFLKNALAEGHFQFDGIGIALMDIHVPIFAVGTQRDHVSPWKSVYKIHLLTDTDTTFVLTVGGHNAGIISEPGHAHRSYQINSVAKGHNWLEPDEWAAQAPRKEGSWWEAFEAWLGQRSGLSLPVSSLKQTENLGAAPGTFVLQRYAD